ncbi:hypothetical protein ACFL3G_12185 [Planctomycetota bacterium]
MAQEEQVLVFERKVFEQLGLFHGLKFDVDNYLEQLFAPGVLRFIPRSLAENDPSFKQLIPYVIMTHDNKYLNYIRGKRAGETRLVEKRSIGIGGHINPVDNDVPLFNDYRDIYDRAVEREVAEEVKINANHTGRIAALLNDDTNEVGRVHLGVVHLWRLDSDNVERKEQMITQMTFKTIEELNQTHNTMETWSALCLEGLEKMSK